jgi:HEAT repeat protein
MRKLAKDRKSPAELRVQAIYHIAKQQDQGSMDLLIDLLDDPLPLVRGRAAGAIASILGTDFSFRPEDNKVQRREVVNGIRRYWSTRKRPSPLVSAKLDR